MTNTLEESEWTVLLRRIEAGRCTPFLGAGAAYGNLPLGAAVARKWATTHNYPLTDVENLPRVAQYLAVHYDSMFPKEALADSFKECCPPPLDDPSDTHAVLADLPLPIYMTTNYDGYMAAALESRKRSPVREIARWNDKLKKLPSVFEQGFVPTPQTPVVFHLHGRLDILDSMVLTEDDYLEFLVHFATDSARAAKTNEPRMLPPRIEEAFTDSSLLFLGYSLADWDFRVLFRTLVEYLAHTTKRIHLSVQLLPVEDTLTDEQKQNVQRYFTKYFDKLDIKVFWGTCRTFLTELRQRREASHGPR